MKKLFLSMITIILLVSLVMPVTVQAATLSVNKTQMRVGELLEVKVTMQKEVESIQFDLKFDNTKYEYINDSAKSKLDATGSNLISENTVRVSAFNLTNTRAKEVTLNFKASAMGEGVPFNIVGVVEIGEAGEQIDNAQITVSKINAIAKTTIDNYYDEFGNLIPRHPQTGEEVALKDKKSIGVYNELVSNKTVVPYAFQNSDTTLTINDLKNEFGAINTTATDIVKTGDTFLLNGIEHTAIIYGDVNKDGKITTLDALTIKRNEIGKVTFDSVQKEAADIEHNTIISEKDALELQKFILGLRVTNTDTLIDRYPKVEVPEILIEGITKLSGESAGPHYIYDTDITIATITSNNEIKLTEDVLDFRVEEAPQGADKENAVQYIDKGDGVFEVKLYATEAGEYKITTIVKGSNVKDGRIELPQEAVTVDQYYSVEALKLFNAQNQDVTDNLVAREAKNMQRKLKLYHKYTDKNSETVYKDITSYIDIENIMMTKTTNHISSTYTNLYNALGEQIVYDVSGNYIRGTGPVDHINIQGVSVGNDTINIKVKNADGTVFEEDVTVTVNTKAKIKSIILNGVELSSTVNGKITLYTANPNLATVEDIGGTYYTIVPIQIRDEDGDIDNIVQNSINKTIAFTNQGRTAVLENATAGTENTSEDIASLRKYTINADGKYQPESSITQKIDAIGIGLDEITEQSIANLKQGITINYEGVSGRETVQVDVTIQEDGIQADSDENEDENASEPKDATQPTNDVVTDSQKAPIVQNNQVKDNTVAVNEIVNEIVTDTVDDKIGDDIENDKAPVEANKEPVIPVQDTIPETVSDTKQDGAGLDTTSGVDKLIEANNE